MIEKIEIAKNTGNYFYTGKLTELDNNWVMIETVKGETVKFRKEQIMQRHLEGEDLYGKNKNKVIN